MPTSALAHRLHGGRSVGDHRDRDRLDDRAQPAPGEEAMMNGTFNIAQTGNVSSETLRAFTDDEMQRIISPA